MSAIDERVSDLERAMTSMINAQATLLAAEASMIATFERIEARFQRIEHRLEAIEIALLNMPEAIPSEDWVQARNGRSGGEMSKKNLNGSVNQSTKRTAPCARCRSPAPILPAECAGTERRLEAKGNVSGRNQGTTAARSDSSSDAKTGEVSP